MEGSEHQQPVTPKKTKKKNYQRNKQELVRGKHYLSHKPSMTTNQKKKNEKKNKKKKRKKQEN